MALGAAGPLRRGGAGQVLIIPRPASRRAPSGPQHGTRCVVASRWPAGPDR